MDTILVTIFPCCQHGKTMAIGTNGRPPNLCTSVFRPASGSSPRRHRGMKRRWVFGVPRKPSGFSFAVPFRFATGGASLPEPWPISAAADEHRTAWPASIQANPPDCPRHGARTACQWRCRSGRTVGQGLAPQPGYGKNPNLNWGRLSLHGTNPIGWSGPARPGTKNTSARHARSCKRGGLAGPQRLSPDEMAARAGQKAGLEGGLESPRALGDVSTTTTSRLGCRD